MLDFFSKRGYNIVYEYRGVSDVPTFKEIRQIVETIVSMYDNGAYDQLVVCYSHFVNTLTSVFRAATRCSRFLQKTWELMI